eukprot:61632-Pelagomonas_calceolata.AAC.1
MGAGSFLEGKPGGVMERNTFKIHAGEGYVCGGVITLNSLMFGNGICTFVARNTNMRFNLVKINGSRSIAHKLYYNFDNMALDMLTVKLW